MPQSVSTQRFSTVAEFELVVAGERHRLSQVSSTFIVFDKPTTLPATTADLYITVDGHPLHRQVRLPKGATPAMDRVDIERL
jgi:hypothetical protein